MFRTERELLNTITVLFPLTAPIIDTGDYTRAVSILVNKLRVAGLTDCLTNTFLFKPTSRPGTTFIDGQLFDAIAEIDRVKGTIQSFSTWAGSTLSPTSAFINQPSIDVLSIPPKSHNKFRFDEAFEEVDSRLDHLVRTVDHILNIVKPKGGKN